MEEKRIVTHHSAAIRGTAVQYDAVVENFIFTAGDGVQEASMVTHTYLRTDAENPAERPVLFAYNGGPGGCSIYVHMAMLAPKRMQMGDIDTLLDDNHLALEDNPDSPLDVCDIVIMDAVSTGFSRLLAEDRAANYYGAAGWHDMTVMRPPSIWSVRATLLSETYCWQRPCWMTGAVHPTDCVLLVSS